MPKFFRFQWASTGDKTAIPDETDVSGFVSYQQGYGNDYARDPASDPLAKLIERDKMNQLYSDLTDNAQYWQTHSFPEYITSAQNGGTAYAYDIDTIVRYDDGGGFKLYQNTSAANTNLPTGAGWVVYNVASLINAATAKTTPVEADIFGIADSAASYALKKLTWANLKAGITGLFVALTGNQTIAGVKTFSSSPIVPTPTAGDNSTKVATTAFVASQDLGVGQTWQDVKASRAFGVTYTNTTGKAIVVKVTILVAGVGSTPNISTNLNGTGNAQIFGNNNANGFYAPVTFIVPNNQTYAIINVSGSGNNLIVAWEELK